MIRINFYKAAMISGLAGLLIGRVWDREQAGIAVGVTLGAGGCWIVRRLSASRF